MAYEGGTCVDSSPVPTNGSGVASFTNLAITGPAGDRTLSFSATGLTAATSGTITITAGAATQDRKSTRPTTSPGYTADAGPCLREEAAGRRRRSRRQR